MQVPLKKLQEMRYTFFLLLLTLLCRSTYAATYFAALTDSDTNPDTICEPFLTIHRAQDAVTSLEL